VRTLLDFRTAIAAAWLHPEYVGAVSNGSEQMTPGAWVYLLVVWTIVVAVDLVCLRFLLRDRR